ncbi:molybdopterin-dependent oxidoreductase [Escherichia coli]
MLPTATWYEKDDINTWIASVSSSAFCGGHSAWESRSDWEIYKGIAKAFSQVCVGHLQRNRRGITTPTA